MLRIKMFTSLYIHKYIHTLEKAFAEWVICEWKTQYKSDIITAITSGMVKLKKSFFISL